MKIVWDKNNQKKDITNFITTITWSGSVNQASRQLEIGVLYTPIDKNLSNININIGDRIIFYSDNNKLLINAMVYTRERLSEQGTVSYSCYDELNRLCKSNGTYSFKNTTPERITKKICADLKLDTTNIVETKVNISKLLIDGESYYTILMKAYTKAHKASGKKYMPLMINKKLSVIEKGQIVESFVLEDKVNITSSSYSESLENMINKVRIFNDKGKQIGEVASKTNIDKFGIFQDVYSKEEGVNEYTAAKNMLQDIDKEASVEALGNIECISGYGVKIKDSISGLTGIFWIDGDSHTWENGVHTMTLDLTFKNLMDIQEIEDGTVKKKAKTKKKSRKKATDNTIVYITSASKKYHSNKSCSGMIEPVEVTKKDAVKRGKGECGKCWVN